MVVRLMSSVGEKDRIVRYPDLIESLVAAGQDPIASRANLAELRAIISPLGFRPPFAAVLEARDAGRSRLDDADQSAALHELVAGLRKHWSVAVSREPADGQLGGRALEVVDTDGGYWLVVRDGPRVELWPVSPTAVFRGLCRPLPLTSELRREPAG
jgi:hypothetical protein